MTLRSRLGVGLVLIALILVGPLVWAIWGIEQLRDDATNLRERDFAASQLIGRLRDGLNDLRREELARAVHAEHRQSRSRSTAS